MPGDPSCAQGWRRHKNACYMYSPMHFDEKWSEANKYCYGSHAQLAQLPDNSDDYGFLSNLLKRRNKSRFWIAKPRDTHESYQISRCPLFEKKISVQGQLQTARRNFLLYVSEVRLINASKIKTELVFF